MRLNGVVDHFLIDCENRRLSDGTIALYRRVLGLMTRRLEQDSKVTELDEVAIVHLRQFLSFLLRSDEKEKRYPEHDRQGKLAPVTVRLDVKIIKAFFKWCVTEDLLKTDPSARLAVPKVPQHVTATFTPEHIEKMLAACDTSKNGGFRGYVLLLTLLGTGGRGSELCDLPGSDVDDRYVKVV